MQLSVENLLERARRSIGLTDFGDPWFLENLNNLLTHINREAGLPSGEVPPVETLVRHLGNRLKLIAYLKRHPEVRNEKVEVSGVIIAHARGGSTLLQRLLTASPQLTGPRWFELVNPVPLPDESLGDPHIRIEMGSAFLASFTEMTPDIKSNHPMDDPMSYDEELMLMNHGFLTMMYSAYFNIPGYQLWLMDQDHTKSYEELKLWLQLLQYQAPERRGRRWLLKAPQHLLTGNLDFVLKAFPEAKLIMTHRHLENVLASLCSSEYMVMLPSQSTCFDARKLGPVVVEMYKRALTNMMVIRNREPPERFIDVQYRDLVTDPIGQFRRVMQLMGHLVGAQDEQAAAKWMSMNARGNFPPHRYALEDYGLTRDMIAESLDFYHQAFLEPQKVARGAAL
jgi:hypothetical protein